MIPATRVRARFAGAILALAATQTMHAQSPRPPALPRPPAAQPRRAPDLAPPCADGPTMFADFGFGGVMPAERWAPITLQISAGDEPVAGAIVLEFAQDSSQRAQITVPFAATPNHTTPVPIIAALPSFCDRVTFTMLTERGGVVKRLTCTRPAGDTSLPLPALIEPDRALLVSVGRTSLSPSTVEWEQVYGAGVQGPQSGASEAPSGQRPPARAGAAAVPTDEQWSHIVAARIDPDSLPTTWMAYNGVTVLVVNTTPPADGQTADPRAIDAVHTWVRSGGRLVLLADGPGTAWRSWLPGDVAGAISLDDAADAPIPAGVAAAIHEIAALTRDATAPEPDHAEPRVVVPPPANAAPSRLVHLTPAAVASGWRTRWRTAAPDQSAGLLAQGPVGFGMVTVLGLDPARTPATLSTRATAAVWRSALEVPMTDWLRDAAQTARVRAQNGWVQTGQERAATMVIGRLADVPIPGDWLFYAIAGAIGLMAIMVGPVDYFVLKRFSAGHRSWLTALGWIALACAVAYAAPRLLRAAPTRVNRIDAIDCILPRPLSATAAPDPTPPTVFATGLTSIYSGESGLVRLLNPDLSSWWRGISVPDPFSRREPEGLIMGAVVPTLQAAAGGQAGSTRGSPLLQLPISLWTFRVFSDNSAVGPNWVEHLNGRVSRQAGGYSVIVGGLPEGASVTHAQLRFASGWLDAERPAQSNPSTAAEDTAQPPQIPSRTGGRTIGDLDHGVWRGRFSEAQVSAEAPAAWRPPEAAAYNFGPWVDPQDSRATHDPHPPPGPVLLLPGPDRRSAAIDTMLGTGRWAALYLDLATMPPEPRLSWPAQPEHTSVLRLLIPISPSDVPQGDAPPSQLAPAANSQEPTAFPSSTP